MADTLQEPPTSLMFTVGWLLFLAGLALLLQGTSMTTTVDVPSAGIYGGGEVVNAGLLQQQSVRVMIGGFTMVSGMCMAVAGKVSELIQATAKRIPAMPATSDERPSTPTDY